MPASIRLLMILGVTLWNLPLVPPATAFSQENRQEGPRDPSVARSRQTETREASSAAGIVRLIETGLKAGSTDRFTPYLANQIYLSLRGIAGGYYSSNQASSILQSFFGSRKILTFRFTTVDDSATTPYATGGGTFLLKGTFQSFQIYVALTKADARWMISQFNLY